MLLSLEVLRRYCQLDDRHIDIDIESPTPGNAGIVDDPANLLSLSCSAHAKFDAFALCFVPTRFVSRVSLLSPDRVDHVSHNISRTRTLLTACMPGQCANTYKIVDHDPHFPGLPLALPSTSLPRTVIFQDLSPSPSRASSISLPSSDLLRAHAALGRVLCDGRREHLRAHRG